MNSSVIPAGWIIVDLNEVLLSIVGGGTPSKANASFYDGDIPWMTVKDLNVGLVEDTIDHISQQGVENSSTNVIPAGTPIVATRMSLGKVVTSKVDSAINQDLKALFFANGIDQSYFVYWYRSIAREIERLGAGTTVKGIRLENLRELQFPLAPQNEQIRIANKLDSLLAKVQETQTRLEKIPGILKRFRQSVLAAATSGELTKNIKFESPNDTKAFSPITIGEENQSAPTKWKWRKLIDIAALESGHTPRKSKPEYWENGDIFWISLQDIRAAHGTTIQDTKFKTNKKGIENSSARLLPKGTVCFSRDISVGFTTIMGSEMATTQHFANWICGSELLNVYLMYALMSAKDHLISSGQGTTVKTIYMPALKNFKILVPPMEEQMEIVRRVESLFALADKVEQQYQAAKQRTDRLTQSLLAKAFRGELVPQNPSDEPASELLKRIQEERDALEKVKPKKKRSVREKASKNVTKRNLSMNKTRKSPEVKDKPYLASILKGSQSINEAKTLFSLSDLTVQDFYKQLAWEIDQGFIKATDQLIEAA